LGRLLLLPSPRPSRPIANDAESVTTPPCECLLPGHSLGLPLFGEHSFGYPLFLQQRKRETQKIKTQEFIFKSTSFEKTINKNKFDLYMLFSDLAKYLSEQNMRVGNLYDLYLVIEELTINEIFKNQLDGKDISIRVRVSHNSITIIYSNLQDFNYEFTNTEDISNKIINSKIINKTIDKNNSRIIYLLDK
jgi:phosphopentomutase